MTKYYSEISIYIPDNNHKSFGAIDRNYLALKKFPNGCPKCWKLFVNMMLIT